MLHLAARIWTLDIPYFYVGVLGVGKDGYKECGELYSSLYFHLYLKYLSNRSCLVFEVYDVYDKTA